MSDKVTFKWKYVEQKAFDDVKHVVTRNTLLSYPYFNKKFHIHAYARDYQLVSVIIKGGKPITFYSSNLTGP